MKFHVGLTFCIIFSKGIYVSGETIGCVTYSSGTYAFVSGSNSTSDAIVCGSYDRSMNETGWNILNAWGESTSSSGDDILSYAAGFFEGYVSATDIYYSWMNFVTTEDTTYVENERIYDQWLYQSMTWTRKTAISKKSSSNYWAHVNFVLERFDGMAAGYLERALEDDLPYIGPRELLLMNSDGDAFDLYSAFIYNVLYPWQKNNAKNTSTTEERIKPLSLKERAKRNLRYSRCSALVRVTPGLEDLYIGHSTWDYYKTMIRIYKFFDLKYYNSDSKARRWAFPGYPGMLPSLDDFYILDTGLVVTETTFDVYSASLYKKLTPNSLLYWIRVMVANTMAQTGEQWMNIYKRHNSGTYNNEWIVLDYNKFKPKTQMMDGLLWVGEQIPGFFHAEDLTKKVLTFGYFPSFNIPYYSDIYLATLQPDDVDDSYEMYVRAIMFRRDQGKVYSLEDMYNILRYNNYENDTYSDGDASMAICSRYDISDDIAFGCLDTKVTDQKMVSKLQSYAVSGPTRGLFDTIAPFSWNETSAMAAEWHIGMPNLFAFKPQILSPKIGN